MAKKTINQVPHIVGARLPVERVRDIKFAKRLRQLMSERELTQSELAAKIWGRHTSSEGKYVAKGRDRISVWLAGRNFPDHDNLLKLAKHLKVKLTDLAPQAEFEGGAQRRRRPESRRSPSPHGETGMSFFQVARYVPDDVAHEIIGLLIKADQNLKGPGKPRAQKDGADGQQRQKQQG